jgi:ATP-dependent protease ClpP protease subunit
MGADTIQVQRNASLMVHDASLMVYGNEDAIRAAADLAAMASDNIADIYSQRTPDMSAADWRKVMQSGDAWYSASEALDAGLVDEVLDPTKKPSPGKPDTSTGPSETDDQPPVDGDDLADLLQGIDLAASFKNAFS